MLTTASNSWCLPHLLAALKGHFEWLAYNIWVYVSTFYNVYTMTNSLIDVSCPSVCVLLLLFNE